jgi:hypothetical protein
MPSDIFRSSPFKNSVDGGEDSGEEQSARRTLLGALMQIAKPCLRLQQYGIGTEDSISPGDNIIIPGEYGIICQGRTDAGRLVDCM